MIRRGLDYLDADRHPRAGYSYITAMFLEPDLQLAPARGYEPDARLASSLRLHSASLASRCLRQRDDPGYDDRPPLHARRLPFPYYAVRDGHCYSTDVPCGLCIGSGELRPASTTMPTTNSRASTGHERRSFAPPWRCKSSPGPACIT